MKLVDGLPLRIASKAWRDRRHRDRFAALLVQDAQLRPQWSTESRLSGFDSVAERARQSNWGLHQLDTGHDPMITKPQDVAEILLKIAGGA